MCSVGAGSVLSFDRTINESATNNKNESMGEAILRRMFSPNVNYTSVLSINENGSSYTLTSEVLGIEAMVAFFRERLWIRDWMQFIPVMMQYESRGNGVGLIHYSYTILIREASPEPVSREHPYYLGYGLGLMEVENCIITRLKFLRSPERTYVMTPASSAKRSVLFAEMPHMP